jgi:hypothetical protein
MREESVNKEGAFRGKLRGAFGSSAFRAVAYAALMAAMAGCGAPGFARESADSGDGVLLGVFHEGAQKDLKAVKDLEKGTERKFASIMWYMDWTSPFPLEDAKRVSKAGYMPHITWEPWSWEKKDLVKLQDILAGKWDKYIGDWAKDAARFGRPLLVRWGHEFNGDWYPWSVPNNGQDPALYVKAYRYVHDAFRDAGAKNVEWIWCFNASSVPALPWNAPMLAYPGDEYADWVGIDGYDFSGTDSFRSIFKNAYAKALSTANKPIMIAEFATGVSGQDKGKWIGRMAADLKEFFPAVRAITWFDINKERDWRLLSGIEAERTAKAVFADEFFISESSAFKRIKDGFASHRDRYLKNLEAQTPKKVAKEASAASFASVRGLDQAKAAWASAKPVTLTSAKGEADMDARIFVGYSKEALFARAEVRDDVPMNNDKKGGDIWNGDNVELCISMDPDADPAREFYGPKDVQIGVSPGKPEKGIGPSVWVWGSLKKTPQGAVVRAEKTAAGYLVEAMIPWSALSPGFAPEKGMKLGFDAAIDDADAKGPDREKQTIWCGDGNFYANPSQWGVIVLE